MTRRSTCGWIPSSSSPPATWSTSGRPPRIAEVLRRYGDERHANGIARAIVRRRPIETTSELVAAIKAGMPPSARFGGGHPAKRSFQAIRIAVNEELDSLDRALPLAWDLLEGRRAAWPRSPFTRSRTGA